MAACGLSAEQAWDVLLPSCTLLEFERLYAHELRTGALSASAQVGAAILSVAVDRNHEQFAQCAFFWQRARAGWRDTRKVETDAKTDLPEEQKTKLIDQIISRVMERASDFAPVEPPKARK